MRTFFFFAILLLLFVGGLQVARTWHWRSDDQTNLPKEFHFDPAKCGQSAGGKIIVRLTTGLAFALPPDVFRADHIDPVLQSTSPIPLGCPENPVVVGYFIVGGRDSQFFEPNNLGSGPIKSLARAASH